jgi:hypothetical protein
LVPRPPVNRVLRVLAQVRARSPGESIGHRSSVGVPPTPGALTYPRVLAPRRGLLGSQKQEHRHAHGRDIPASTECLIEVSATRRRVTSTTRAAHSNLTGVAVAGDRA